MIKNLIAFAFILIIPPKLFAQTVSTISFSADWPKGETKSFLITKKQSFYKNDVIESSNSHSYIARFTVIDSMAKFYALTCRFENLLYRSAPVSEEFLPIIEKQRYVTLIYTTDQLGVFGEVINWKEISGATTKMLDTLPYFIPKDSTDFLNTLEKLKVIYSTRRGIESLLSKEIQFIHWPYGLQFNVKDTLKHDEYLPNLFGGPRVKAKAKTYFQLLDFENQRCSFTTLLELDTTTLSKVLTETINNYASNAKFESKKDKARKLKEMQQEFSEMKMKIYGFDKYNYSYVQGWPTRVEIMRTAEIIDHNGKKKRVDETLIEEVSK